MASWNTVGSFLGPSGLAATVTVGTVTTGLPGAGASFVNVGDTHAAVFNVTIPQGSQGIQGIQGIQGVTGPTGPNSTTIKVFKVQDGGSPSSAYGTFGTRDSGALAVWQFTNVGAVDSIIVFSDIVPQGVTWATGLQAVIWWGSTTATTGKVEFSAAIDNVSTHSFDTDSYGTAVSVSTTTSGSAANPNTTVISIPTANLQSLAAELPYKLKITRRASDTANDTMADIASIAMILLRTY